MDGPHTRCGPDRRRTRGVGQSPRAPVRLQRSTEASRAAPPDTGCRRDDRSGAGHPPTPRIRQVSPARACVDAKAVLVQTRTPVVSTPQEGGVEQGGGRDEFGHGCIVAGRPDTSGPSADARLWPRSARGVVAFIPPVDARQPPDPPNVGRHDHRHNADDRAGDPQPPSIAMAISSATPCSSGRPLLRSPATTPSRSARERFWLSFVFPSTRVTVNSTPTIPRNCPSM